ncbi:MAG: hypothetical protein WC603_02815 [Candidatus Paceibacterota bacterium]|jgi:hypothetical protein
MKTRNNTQEFLLNFLREVFSEKYLIKAMFSIQGENIPEVKITISRETNPIIPSDFGGYIYLFEMFISGEFPHRCLEIHIGEKNEILFQLLQKSEYTGGWNSLNYSKNFNDIFELLKFFPENIYPVIRSGGPCKINGKENPDAMVIN